MARDILIRGADIVSPANGLETKGDILVQNGTIARIAKNISAPDAQIVEAEGFCAIPGIIDMHAHLCEPGNEERETIASGLRAAVEGGITSVLCMPDTNPPVNTLGILNLIREKAEREKLANLFVAACMTTGPQTSVLVEMDELARAGARAFTNAAPCTDSLTLRRAMEYASMTGRVIIDHPEDTTMSGQGVMNEGTVSTRLGLKGVPHIAEDSIVARDELLSEYLDIPIHIAPVSSARAVRIIKEAKKRGVKVTAETSPQYFCLTEKALADYDTNFKLCPPLRTEKDRREIIRGLKEGTIDAITSDHTPLTDYEKEVEFDHALPGGVGLETMLALSLTFLIATGDLTMGELASRLSCGPARILGLSAKGRIEEGADADITLVDPGWDAKIDPKAFATKSRNCAFSGMDTKGRAAATIVGGRIVMLKSRA